MESMEEASHSPLVHAGVQRAGVDAGESDGLTSSEGQELAALRRENRRLREDVDALKRATVHPFIEAETRAGHSVQRACELLKVSRTAFYARRTGKPGPRAVRDAELTGQITEVRTRSREPTAPRASMPCSRCPGWRGLLRGDGSSSSAWRTKCATRGPLSMAPSMKPGQMSALSLLAMCRRPWGSRDAAWNRGELSRAVDQPGLPGKRVASSDQQPAGGTERAGRIWFTRGIVERQVAHAQRQPEIRQIGL
jgi:hypothetical protein